MAIPRSPWSRQGGDPAWIAMFLVVNFDLAKDHVSEVLARGGDRGPAWTGFDAEKDFPARVSILSSLKTRS